VEKVSFDPGMKQWMCDGGWEWWAGGRWIRSSGYGDNRWGRTGVRREMNRDQVVQKMLPSMHF